MLDVRLLTYEKEYPTTQHVHNIWSCLLPLNLSYIPILQPETFFKIGTLQSNNKQRFSRGKFNVKTSSLPFAMYEKILAWNLRNTLECVKTTFLRPRMRNSLLNRELSKIRKKAYLVPRGQSCNTPKGVFGNQRVNDGLNSVVIHLVANENF